MIAGFLRRIVFLAVVLGALGLGGIWLIYGTLSPCHIAAADLKGELGLDDTDDSGEQNLLGQLGGLLGQALAAPYIDDRAENAAFHQCTNYMWQRKIEGRGLGEIDEDAMAWLRP